MFDNVITGGMVGLVVALGLELAVLVVRNVRLQDQTEQARGELAGEKREHRESLDGWHEADQRGRRWEAYARTAEEELAELQRRHRDLIVAQQRPAGPVPPALNELGQPLTTPAVLGEAT